MARIKSARELVACFAVQAGVGALLGIAVVDMAVGDEVGLVKRGFLIILSAAGF